MVQILRATGSRLAWRQALAQATTFLERGKIVALPTETLYGLCACLNQEAALERVYVLKKRPSTKAMPLIIGDAAQLMTLAESVNDRAQELIKHFWPGPLTLVFTACKELSPFVALNNTVAVRMPGQSFALEVARAVGAPLIATSANISGYEPATNAQQVHDYFSDDLDLIVDAGPSPLHVGSTIIDVRGPRLRVVREGAIDLAELERIIPRDRGLWA